MRRLYMYFTRILLSIVFVLFASTALAAKPHKTLVCHVGNELSSMGETYMENPDCTIPGDWVGDFTCPDAGKIDLILVSSKAKHIGNEAHSFGGDSDYAPLLADVGDDPADFEDNTEPRDGIDDGCETEELLTCPCWNTYTEAELVVAINAQPSVDLICQDATWEATMILDVAGFNPRLIAFEAPEEPGEPPFCEFQVGESGLVFHFLDTATTSHCKQELSGLIPMIPGCL
jgi:hypothetical protein